MIQGRFDNVRQFARFAEHGFAGPAHVVPIPGAVLAPSEASSSSGPSSADGWVSRREGKLGEQSPICPSTFQVNSVRSWVLYG